MESRFFSTEPINAERWQYDRTFEQILIVIKRKTYSLSTLGTQENSQGIVDDIPGAARSLSIRPPSTLVINCDK